MATPGSNILNKATRLIARQTLNYYKFNGRAANQAFQDVATFEAPVVIRGSFQPVARDKFMQNGLDFDRSYFNLFVPANVIGLGRDRSGDQLTFNGRRYQCETITPWFAIDGWNEVLCIDIGEA